MKDYEQQDCQLFNTGRFNDIVYMLSNCTCLSTGGMWLAKPFRCRPKDF